MTAMRKKGRFWHDIKFKYRLTVLNENSLEEVGSLHVSKLAGLLLLVLACIFIFLVAALIIVYTPLRGYLPGYMNSDVRQQVVVNALRADSLQEALYRHGLYIQNIQDIIGGKVKTDTIQSIDSLAVVRAEELMERSREEEEFIRQYEERERYNLTAVSENPSGEGLIFFPPVRGTVVKRFDSNGRHYGTDIQAVPKSSIVAALDGTVIFAAYTAETEYVIQIQHSQNFVSVYKYCGALMTRQGDAVKGGEVIALIGGAGTEREKPHVHFELWHKGTPVDAEQYVVF